MATAQPQATGRLRGALAGGILGLAATAREVATTHLGNDRRPGTRPDATRPAVDSRDGVALPDIAGDTLADASWEDAEWQ